MKLSDAIRSPLLYIAICLFAAAASLTHGQALPNKIRGYKVHNEPIKINKRPDAARRADSLSADLAIGDPKINDMTIAGVDLEIPVEFLVPDQSGKVDFLSFYDIKINGIPVTVPDYTARFAFEKGVFTRLPQPARLHIPTPRIVHAAWKEVRDSKEQWIVTGRIFVFGRFKKWGFYHKRVVPIDLTMSVRNPFHN